jgi:benzoyl-CoA-dihydrodiol lyase
VQRLRFEHPEVRAVIVTSGNDKVFCAGANIRMLAGSEHPAAADYFSTRSEGTGGARRSGGSWAMR